MTWRHKLEGLHKRTLLPTIVKAESGIKECPIFPGLQGASSYHVLIGPTFVHSREKWRKWSSHVSLLKRTLILIWHMTLVNLTYLWIGSSHTKGEGSYIWIWREAMLALIMDHQIDIKNGLLLLVIRAMTSPLTSSMSTIRAPQVQWKFKWIFLFSWTTQRQERIWRWLWFT